MFKHLEDAPKALVCCLVLRHNYVTRNYPVDQFDKDIAELQQKLGEACKHPHA